jgi:KDO2-lipid IV(A) lauroyltransferase
MRCLWLPPLVVLAKLIARLPQPWLLRLAALMSFVLAPVLARRRRIAWINLQKCYPELSSSERRRLVRANQRSTVMGVLELMRAWYAPTRRLGGLAEIEGLEHLRAVLARGQGVLLFGGHFTDSELAARLLGEALGRMPRVVVRANNNACLERWFDSARANAFGPTIAKKDTRKLLRALRNGEVVAYSADQNFTYQNAFVPFFGIPAATLVSSPEMVRRAGAVMLPFWFHRDAEGRYRLRVETAWAGWGEGDPAASAAIYMRELEVQVRRHPEQYLWMHRRFKTRPPGEPAFY